MSLRRGVGLALAAASLTAPAPASPARAAACRFHGAKTVAANGLARVFVIDTRDDVSWYGGCLRRDGIPRYVSYAGLDVEGVEDYVEVRLAGPYVATVDGANTSAGLSYATVTVRDLRRRGRAPRLAYGSTVHFHGAARTVHTAPATGAHPDQDGVESLVLRRTGGVAWIGHDLVEGTYEVWKIDGHRKRLLDRSASIDPGSLVLRGRCLTWRDGGAERAGTLF